jgi:hypothetical protein
MKTVIIGKKIPNGSIIKDPEFQNTNYEDSISIEIDTNEDYTVDYLATVLFSSLPGWVLGLLKFRNIIVKPFGLKTDGTFSLEEIQTDIKYKIGDIAVFFKVIKRSEIELVMAENDKHLNFRTSVLIESLSENNKLKVSSLSIVKYNNLFGKIYFLPVKPFHRLIIKTLLKNLNKNLSKNLNKNKIQ